MGRPRQHNESTGEALLDAAEQQLAAGGADAVSVRGVALAVGTTTRAVYSVFGGIEGLLAGLAIRGFNVLGERVDAVEETDDPIADWIRTGEQAFRSFALERPHLFRLTFERIPTKLAGDEEVLKAAAMSATGLVKRIKRCQRAGLIVDRPTRELIFTFHSFCQGLANCELAHQPPPVGANFWPIMEGVDMQKLWEQAVTSFVHGLRKSDNRESRHE